MGPFCGRISTHASYTVPQVGLDVHELTDTGRVELASFADFPLSKLVLNIITHKTIFLIPM